MMVLLLLRRVFVGFCVVRFSSCSDVQDAYYESTNSEAEVQITSRMIRTSNLTNPSLTWNYESFPVIPGAGQIVNGTVDIVGSNARNNSILILSCNATCPVQWRFYPAKDQLLRAFIGIDIPSLEREGNYYNVSRNSHLAHLAISTTSDEMTGNYVCECVDNPDKKSQVYVFCEELDKSLLLNAGRFFLLDQDANGDWLDLPCGTSNRSDVYLLGVDFKKIYQVFVETTPMEDVLQMLLQKSAFDNLENIVEVIFGNLLDDAPEDAAHDYVTLYSPNASITRDQFSGFRLRTAELPTANENIWICTLIPDRKDWIWEETVKVKIMGIGKQKEDDYRPNSSRLIPTILNNGNRRHSVGCCRETCVDCSPENLYARIYPVKNVMMANLFLPLLERSVAPTPRNNPITRECLSKEKAPFSCECSTVDIPESIKYGLILQCNAAKSKIYMNQDYFYFNVSDRLWIVQNNSDTTTSTMAITHYELAERTEIAAILGSKDQFDLSWYQNSLQDSHEVITWTYTDSENGTVKNSSESRRVASDHLSSSLEVKNSSAEGERRCFLLELSMSHFQTQPRWTIEWLNGSLTEDTRYTTLELNNENQTMGFEVPPRITSSFCPVMDIGIKSISCHAPSWDTSNWKSFTLKPPRIIATEKPTVHGISGAHSFIGDSVELNCTISSKSPVRIEWYASGRILQSSTAPTGSCLKNECKPVVSSLTVRKSDNKATNYTCIATNYKGTDKRTDTYEPEEPVLPYILGQTEEQLQFVVGEEKRILKCSASGRPLPDSISWFKDGDGIPENPSNGTSTVGENELTSTLTINEVGLNSAGIYTCVASNRFGKQAFKSFHVNVTKPPTTRNIIIGSAAALVMLAIGFGFLLRKYRRENKELIKLEKMFRQGIQDSEVLDGAVQSTTGLPYTGEFEISKSEWTKIRKIGGGYFGVVYYGELRQSNATNSVVPIALKFIDPSDHQIENLKILCAELKMMMRIKQLGANPNIVNFLGATTKDFQKMEVYLIMEYCSLGSLQEYLTTHRDSLLVTHDWAAIVHPDVPKWCEEIALGMMFLSSHKIIHIDLAARNVFLTEDRVAKVGDYGLSRSLYGKRLYKKQSPFRPELWTALEGLRDNLYSVESDVWSYGVTIWEIFAMGKEPAYVRHDTIESLEKGERLGKPALASAETYQIMKSCWNVDPQSRPSFHTLAIYFQNLGIELAIKIEAISNDSIINPAATCLTASGSNVPAQYLPALKP